MVHQTNNALGYAASTTAALCNSIPKTPSASPMQSLLIGQQDVIEAVARLEGMVERLIGSFPTDPVPDAVGTFGGLAGEVQRVASALSYASRRIHNAISAAEQAII